jgi:peptidoglycan/xylan/chitin deacetylase (PgdA/CDA1 family)
MSSARVSVGGLVCVLALVAATGVARAADCPGHPDAIGTSRTIYVDPAEHARVGTMQYHETLPLNDHEIVLTFDDGPLPPKTTRVLDVLASECVKATFFTIGKMAQTYPAVLRREYAEGHSIGTHSQNHPLNFQHASLPVVQQEVEDGIASVTAALGDANDVAPFFRIPGLLRQDAVDDYLNSRGLMVFSADFLADDWKHIKASEVYRRALMRIEARHKGVLLLHDIQPATVAALPMLLKELKRRGYHIVHVAPATADQPKTATVPSQWLMSGKKPAWTPEVVAVDPVVVDPIVNGATKAAEPAPSIAPPPSAAPQSSAVVLPFDPLSASLPDATTLSDVKPNARTPDTSAPTASASNANALSVSAPSASAPSPSAPSASAPSPGPPSAAAPIPLRNNTVAVLRGRIPLPPARPRAIGERSAIRTVPLPLPNPQYVGHAGILKPAITDEHRELTTGSIGPAAAPPPTDQSADSDGPTIRPAADIPIKAPVAANTPTTGIR